jgi:hypothetical protein
MQQFKVKIVRPGSDNPRVLPRLFDSIPEAQAFVPNSGTVVAVVYPNGSLAKRVA